VLLVCSLFAIGFTPAANADSYEYTVTFNSAAYLSGESKLTMAVSFVLPGLLDGTMTSINPSAVHVLEAPIADAPVGVNNSYLPVSSSLVSLSASNQEIDVVFTELVCPGGPCGVDPSFPSSVRWERQDNYVSVFDAPIAGMGIHQAHFSELIDATFGYDPVGESHNTYMGDGDSVSVVATPEPNTGSLVGACFLCCLMIVSLRRSA
jgi:hypothetical protein